MNMAKYPARMFAAFVAATLALTMSVARADSLTLELDPFSGAGTIVNSTGAAVALDGYQITSSSGVLVPGSWHSLTSLGTPGWSVAASTSTGLAELNLTSSTLVGIGSSLALGNLYTPFATNDVAFKYSMLDYPQVATGTVEYSGGLQLVVHTIVGNHSATVTGAKVVLTNPEPMAISTDGYTIQSASGSLTPAGFTGFASRGLPGWEVVQPSGTGLAELNLASATAIASHASYILGSAVAPGSPQDLTFKFDAVGIGQFAGSVSYVTELGGDANHDGVVNGLDIALVASNWLHSGSLTGDTNYDGVVNGLDIALIASHWLNTITPVGGGSGAAAVPEPTSLILITSGAVLGLRFIRRQRITARR